LPAITTFTQHFTEGLRLEKKGGKKALGLKSKKQLIIIAHTKKSKRLLREFSISVCEISLAKSTAVPFTSATSNLKYNFFKKFVLIQVYLISDLISVVFWMEIFIIYDTCNVSVS